MNRLAEILSSRARAEIFRLLFRGANEEFHVREIQRRSGLNDRTIRQELQKLVRLDLIKGRRDGNRIYYGANRENSLYADIRNVVLKTIGLADALKDALKDDRIRIVFVFGSIAKGEEKAESDVDLMVIGDLGLRHLTKLLSGVSEKIGREINPHVLAENEFQKRIESKEHFIANVLKSPKIFIIGSDNDLKALGG
jgi:predicted nucleotidyltransferase